MTSGRGAGRLALRAWGRGARYPGELLADNLEFHLRQGVDDFIITDNGSVEGTSGVIRDYERAGLAGARRHARTRQGAA
jgi:hypothetical protein